MKTIILLFVLSFSFIAQAEVTPLTEEAFFNNYEDVWEVKKIERQFYDELLDEAIYLVDFSYVTKWACAGSGEIDFCGPATEDDLVETCEYFRWNGEYKELEATGVNCSESVDVLIDEKLYDEY